jgi:hypothetical protein
MPVVWLWLIRIGGAVLGCGAGFGVAPLVSWLMDLTGSAPGPLRLAAQLPTAWAVPVLTVVGAVAGVWVASIARKESPVVTVDGDHIAVHEGGSGLHLRRDRVGVVFTDGRDLVVLDHGEGDGTVDPREAEFVRWVDGSPDLDNGHPRTVAGAQAGLGRQTGRRS